MNANSTFFGNPELKAELLAQGQMHLDADMLHQEIGYHKERDGHFAGCTIGCYAAGQEDYFDKISHLSNNYNIPIRLLACVDSLFEQLPKTEIAKWHLEWVNAIPCGIELSKIETVCDKLILAALKKKAVILKQEDNVHILAVSRIYERRVAGDEPSKVEWENAALAALADLAALAALDALDALDAFAALAALDARDARDALDVFQTFAIEMRDMYLQLMGELA